MKATEIFRSRDAYGKGFIEIVIWQVPEPVSPSRHSYRYRLVYIVDGERIVGYDNERGKGDHKHLGTKQRPYRFVSPAQLMTDFMDDVKGARK